MFLISCFFPLETILICNERQKGLSGLNQTIPQNQERGRVYSSITFDILKIPRRVCGGGFRRTSTCSSLRLVLLKGYYKGHISQNRCSKVELLRFLDSCNFAFSKISIGIMCLFSLLAIILYRGINMEKVYILVIVDQDLHNQSTHVFLP